MEYCLRPRNPARSSRLSGPGHPGRPGRPGRPVRRALILLVLIASGCGTTRVTDTQRTATEQLLVSNAVDEAVNQMDFQVLANKPVFLDTQYLDNAVDRGYLISSLRQHLLASGCLLQDDRQKAMYVVEARAGGIGTDRHSLLFGVPQMNIPSFVPGQPSQIPEIPLAKKTDQKGVAKVAVFAYNRITGRPVWQSGIVQSASTSKDWWLFGAGPFQHGTIRERTEFAGQPIAVPFFAEKPEEENADSGIAQVTSAAEWSEPEVRPLGLGEVLGLPLVGLRHVNLNLAAVVASSCTPEGQVAIHNAVRRLTPSMILPVAAPAVKAPSPPPAPTPNAGGQAETLPAKMVDTFKGFLPDG